MFSPTRLSRQLRRLLDIGVIKRATGSYRYYLTNRFASYPREVARIPQMQPVAGAVIRGRPGGRPIHPVGLKQSRQCARSSVIRRQVVRKEQAWAASGWQYGAIHGATRCEIWSQITL